MEILAPAGDFSCLRAAISGGADAVYVGGSRFSARKSAANFDDDELLSAVDYCHLRDKKIYVAINTMIKESEYRDALSFLEYVRKIGADGVILSDLGLIAASNKSFPDLRINASTQLTVHSKDGVNVISKLGAKRVVLARELSFSDICNIKKATSAELEVFVHGALCMSYSGQCLFSSIIGARSGNRGACAQPCRLPYRLFEGNRDLAGPKPLLSPKDLCLIKRLDELERAGVASLKIEGRMKSPEYVWLVSRTYSDAKKYGYDPKEAEKMLAAFSRGGSSEGFFFGRTFEKMMDYSGGAKVDKSRTDFKIPEPESVVPISMSFSAASFEPTALVAKSGELEAVVSGKPAEQAIKVSLSCERAKEQLGKLGATPFYAKEITCDIKEGTSYSIKEINELRRKACELLMEKICLTHRREDKKAEFDVNPKASRSGFELTCEVLTAEQAIAAKEMGIRRIYVPIEEREKLAGKGDFIFVLPAICRDNEKPEILPDDSVCIQNIGQLEDAKGAKEFYLSHRFNISNRAAICLLEKMGAKGLVISPELNLKEIKRISDYAQGVPEIIAYGRLPLMVCENCLMRSAAGKCICKNGEIYLKDRIGEKFPVINQNCRSVVLNSKKIFIADKISQFKSLGADLRLMFTIESSAEVKEIIKIYNAAISGDVPTAPIEDFTRGHFARGVI